MKHLFIALCCSILCGNAFGQQPVPIVSDTIHLPPNTIRVVATVKSVDDKTAVLKVDNIIAYGQGVITILSEGDDVTVRMPGKNKPSVTSKIEVNLREKIEVGDTPTSYILLTFKTVDH